MSGKQDRQQQLYRFHTTSGYLYQATGIDRWGDLQRHDAILLYAASEIAERRSLEIAASHDPGATPWRSTVSKVRVCNA